MCICVSIKTAVHSIRTVMANGSNGCVLYNTSISFSIGSDLVDDKEPETWTQAHYLKHSVKLLAQNFAWTAISNLKKRDQISSEIPSSSDILLSMSFQNTHPSDD